MTTNNALIIRLYNITLVLSIWLCVSLLALITLPFRWLLKFCGGIKPHDD